MSRIRYSARWHFSISIWEGEVSMVIQSAANPLIKRIRALENRRERERAGMFWVEGIAPVWSAVESGAAIDTLIIAPDLLTSTGAREMVAAAQAKGVRVTEVSGDLFARLAAREHPSGLGAVVQMTRRTLDDLIVIPDALFVALDAVGNPGNLGTILRTADAVGAHGAVLLGDSTDPYHASAVKASMGALFRVPVVAVSSVGTLLDWCHARGVGVVTTSAHAAVSHWEAVYPAPTLVLFGSEAQGLAPDVLAAGDLAVRIPMYGGVTSLNLAVAAGILLYEVRRTRDVHSRE